MQKIVIAAAALAAFATTSYAADLPARMPVKAMPAPVVQSWTGCYLGAGAGYSMTNRDNTTRDVAGVLVAGRTTEGGRGWFGTVQGGCDYQFDPTWLVGAFADGNWGSVRGDWEPSGLGFVGMDRVRSSWAAGARLGYLISPQFLAFGSAGWTEARHDAIAYNSIPGVVAGFFSNRQNMDGWFLGTGYEYKLAWLPGFTWKTEYRFSDFGNRNTTIFTAAGAPFINIRNHVYDQEIRSELVWRFNSWIR
jgi:outer membrane immunogenic protein